MGESPTSWVVLAHILRPQGRRGEVLAELLTDFPEKFEERGKVFLASPGFAGTASSARQAEVVAHWLPVGKNAGRVVLQFAGIESISDAEKLAGLDVMVPSEERVELADDAAYTSDLVGCTLFDNFSEVGLVTDVQFAVTPNGARRLEDAAPLLVVTALDGSEVLVPFAKAFLVSMNVAQKRIEMELPEGLLEVNRADATKQARKR